MKCETCHGIGLLEIPAECDSACDDRDCPYIHIPYTVPCRDCGGSGVASCCDGLSGDT